MRRIAITLLLIVISAFANAQTFINDEFVGKWWLGMLEEAVLPINITFERNTGKDNNIRPVLYSPIQTAEAMPASEWSYSGDTMRITHKSTGVKMVLVWNASEGTFTGTMRQGLMRSNMHFSPTDGIFKLNRPQTPNPPYPYSEQEVVITRKKAGVVITGTLSLPQGDGSYPAVVLVSGSGQQNRDEELMGHKPFKVIADHLARAGVAVLRYDDRGVGGTKGDVESATTLDFADDAEAVFDYLRKQPHINSKRVGIVGHSEGALIASIVASRNKRVAFIVLLAGQSCSGAEIMLQQNQAIYEANNVPQGLIDIRLKSLEAMFTIVDTAEASKVEALCRQVADSYCSKLSKEERKKINMRRADAIMLLWGAG